MAQAIGSRNEPLFGVALRAKRENIAGLQLADLVVSPIGRFVLGKPVREDFRIVEGKFRWRGGRYEDEGLVVLPPDDQVIFLAAMAARATHLLTGDRTHFGPYYGRTIAGVLILPPSVYLRG